MLADLVAIDMRQAAGTFVGRRTAASGAFSLDLRIHGAGHGSVWCGVVEEKKVHEREVDRVSIGRAKKLI